jgi:histidine ammonia-lyase
MAPWAGVKLGRILKNLSHILAVEALAAAEAIDLQRPAKTTRELEPLQARIRELAPAAKGDRRLDGDMARVATALGDGSLLSASIPSLGNLSL